MTPTLPKGLREAIWKAADKCSFYGFTDPKICVGIYFDAIAPFLPSRPSVEQGEWSTGIPDVKVGGCETFWCAIEGVSGKTFHRYLDYANKHIMPLADGIDDAPEGVEPVPNSEEDFYWTGWHEKSCDHCDTQWMFSQRVIAWTRLPKYEAAQPTVHGDTAEGATPLTDAMVRTYESGHGRPMDFEYVDPEDARTLELKLAAANAIVVDECKLVLKLDRQIHNLAESNTNLRAENEKLRGELEAAIRFQDLWKTRALENENEAASLEGRIAALQAWEKQAREALQCVSDNIITRTGEEFHTALFTINEVKLVTEALSTPPASGGTGT